MCFNIIGVFPCNVKDRIVPGPLHENFWHACFFFLLERKLQKSHCQAQNSMLHKVFSIEYTYFTVFYAFNIVVQNVFAHKSKKNINQSFNYCGSAAVPVLI